MTGDGEALFRAICEHPQEDTPRLAYADWLEESGVYQGRKSYEATVRASYIRHEIAFARREPEAVRTHSQLLATTFAGYHERWLKELPKIPGVSWPWSWQRGFPTTVCASAKAIQQRADQIFTAAPVTILDVNRVTTKALPKILTCPYFTRVEWFRLAGTIGDEGASQVAQCANLRNVASLVLSSVEMTDVGLEALARATVFERLRALHFAGNAVTERGAYALLDSITLNELAQISWYPNPISAVAVGALRQRFHDPYTGAPGA
ncbi:Putative Leucine-rich repeat-containing protein typical subtype OS=Nitrospina gracilis (strain 3/211) GN=NITGR_170119 PE=4 SV=1 [Gemmata massiliana]|uniref:Repeat-companion domain protein n=1 Tax=Gemmata massiliana TaxID=1210884 RepID=A0A6P2CXK6_9BACT|nr:TIGR02996 domain-containing protein [Gemmata massiliana]VTR93721.1 Putative Leucine-rich repeat-containing protein typical subtype OS=Nitrospina gracilis (strain 3/211) GN=NITGR_170119 PE=4 SV=1 [Gemmata massiliana]